MSTTPTAELARVKVQHPVWAIQRNVPSGDSRTRFTARRRLAGGRVLTVYAATPSRPGARAVAAESDGAPPPSGGPSR